ncbi:hypothetical protein LG322_10080 [Microbacterium aerolatum]|uniref:hypothetical protein n=1 Tax=Microbacterium aerolatum TaxID=153731 RepID=UPI00384AC48C
MDVEELLTRAWGAVEKAGIPEPLHEYAFKEALSILSAETSGDASLAPKLPKAAKQGAGVEEGSKSDDSGGQSDKQIFSKFAQESGVPEDQLERLYYFEDGVPHIIGPKARFGSNLADQARAVSLALTAAYDYALDQQNIAVGLVRAECERLKCDPGSNWNKAMNSLTTVNYVGAPGKKTMRAKSDTGEALQKLAKSALGIAE